MKKIVKKIIQSLQIISICAGLILGGLIAPLYDVIGHKRFENLLSIIGIDIANGNSFNLLVWLCIIFIFLIITTTIINYRL